MEGWQPSDPSVVKIPVSLALVNTEGCVHRFLFSHSFSSFFFSVVSFS